MFLFQSLCLFLLLLFSVPRFLHAIETSELETIPVTGCLKLDDQRKKCIEPVAEKPSHLAWEKAKERVGSDTRIPHPGKKQLSYKTGQVFQKEIQTVDLAQQVPKWLSFRFEPPAYNVPEPWMQSVGNMLEKFQETRGDAQAQERLLKQLKTEAPDVWEQVLGFLPEWVHDDYLYSSNWSPENTGKPGKSKNDDILERPPFLLPSSPAGSEKGRKVYQACAPVYTSMEDLLAAESDFRNYHKQAEANYLEVFPVEGTYFSGKNPDGFPYMLYDISYHQKPLALWNLRFVLRQFLHKQGDRWQMENHLRQGDMNHLRIRIFYDPITTLDGKVIGYVKTEWLDVDIKGLPDRDADRMAGARGDVGNIKLMAEKGNITRKPSREAR